MLSPSFIHHSLPPFPTPIGVCLILYIPGSLGYDNIYIYPWIWLRKKIRIHIFFSHLLLLLVVGLLGRNRRHCKKDSDGEKCLVNICQYNWKTCLLQIVEQIERIYIYSYFWCQTSSVSPRALDYEPDPDCDFNPWLKDLVELFGQAVVTSYSHVF